MGFAHKVSPDQIRASVLRGDLQKHLNRVEAKKGDMFFIPSGTVHAIGSGIVVAEIQENSNVTYRLFDYNRTDKNGQKRELHIEKALDVMNMEVQPLVRQGPRIMKYYPGCSREMLCRCKYFEAERICSSLGFSFSVMEESFQVLLCTGGRGGISTETCRPIRFKEGDCIFIPAGAGRCHAMGEFELLKVRC